MLRRALDALDFGVILMPSDLTCVFHMNSFARDTLGTDRLPETLQEAVEHYVSARRDTRRFPPAFRWIRADQTFFLRVTPSNGDGPAFELICLRPEVIRDVEALRVLEARYGVTRREYQIICALRLGKTNSQVADELSISEGTVARHIHRLLSRFSVANRTRLVDVVEKLLRSNY